MPPLAGLHLVYLWVAVLKESSPLVHSSRTTDCAILAKGPARLDLMAGRRRGRGRGYHSGSAVVCGDEVDALGTEIFSGEAEWDQNLATNLTSSSPDLPGEYPLLVGGILTRSSGRIGRIPGESLVTTW